MFVSSSSMLFRDTTFKTSSAAQTVTLLNSGKAPLTLSRIALGGINADSFNETNNCKTQLKSGESCEITARFIPATTGALTAVITITDDASPAEQTIDLRGSAPSIGVSVSPADAVLTCNHVAQLTAAVTNASNTGVTWSINPAGVGSISASGLYTAPPAVSSPQTVAITATSQADPTAAGSMTVMLAPQVAVSVGPANAVLTGNQAIQLTAAVANTSDTGVTWSLSPSGVGSISASGLYTAPPAVSASETVTVAASSNADPTAVAFMTINLVGSPPLTVSPMATALVSGQTMAFNASESNTSNISVTWSALRGAITPGGLYTAPSNTSSSTLVDTITATSVEDPTVSATATVTVSSGMVGWWPLDEGTGTVAYDASGQGNNATWSGMPGSPSNTYYAMGEVGSSAGYFGGGDASLTIGTKPAYQFTGPFTLSAWANSVSGGTILSMQDGSANGYNLAMVYGVIRFCNYVNTADYCVFGGNYPSSTPTWTYFTAVFDGSALSIYANGVLLQSHPAPAPTASTGPLVAGIAQRGGYGNFTGSLDDVRVYDRALSAGEVSALYNASVGTPSGPTNLLAFPGNGQVALTWNTPTEGARVTNYLINYRATGTATWTAFPHNPSILGAQVLTGLTNGTSYDFQITGSNSFGLGAPSDVTAATPTTTPPTIGVSIAPHASTATSGSNLTFTTSVTNASDSSVTWSALRGTITPEGLYTAPSNTGNSMITDTITATSVEDPTASATATVTVSSGLIGWWPLDEGTGTVANDASGQGNNGMWSGTPGSPTTTYYTAGVIGSSAGYFGGGDASLTIGTKPVYKFTGPYTLSVWANSVSGGTILSMHDGSANGYDLAMDYGAIRFCNLVNSAEFCVAGGSYPSSTPTWTYFTAVFDGSTLSIYANGVLLQSRHAPAPTASTGSLVAGIAQRGGYGNFTGSLDDLRVYSRALSASEVSGLYNANVGAPSASTNLLSFPGNGQVALTWNTPPEGAIVTNYLVNYRVTGTDTWTVFSHNPSILNAQVVTGLTNGTSYDFEVIPVSGIENGMASNTATAAPTNSGWSVIPSDDDEFIGPFPSWLNIRTFGAVGDGVADDSVAFQTALNALASETSHASILYIPSGTYKITSDLSYISRNCDTYCSGKSIIGENPQNTILKWEGNAAGGNMVTLDGANRMQFNRLTLDGGNAQITLVNETMHQGCCYDGSNEYADDIFENAFIGLQAGDNTVGCCSAETKVDRDTFVNLSQAGISLEDWNAVDWYVRYSTFAHDNYAVTNSYGAGGAMHLDHNLFEYNTIDSFWGNGSSQSYTYNVSYHSGTFLSGSPYGNTSVLIGNTILFPASDAIVVPGIGPLTLINNVIEGPVRTAESGPAFTINGDTAALNSYVTSMGNTYITATPFSVQNVLYHTDDVSGGLTSINDTVVPIASIPSSPPIMPGVLPNYHRPVYEVPQGASSATIQAAIDEAIRENGGHRPVVHIPWGQYSVDSTITIPAESDVQIVGDNMQTVLNWSGSAASPVLAILPSSHAAIRDLMINAGSSSAGILVQGRDQPGDRIYTNFAAENAPGSLHNLLVNGFDNTFIQMDDFGHGGLTNPASTSVLVAGGPLSRAGQASFGYTGLFMGASCCNTSSYRVDGGATLVVTGFWYEQGGPGWLDLDAGSGTFIGYQDSVGIGTTVRAPTLAANNFSGTLILANTLIGGSYVNLSGTTPASVLMLGDVFSPQVVKTVVQPPVIVNTNTNPNTQAATVDSTWLSGSVSYTVPDEISPGTYRTGLIQDSLLQLAKYKDPAVSDLPSANEDVRLVDVVINNGLNSFDFEATNATPQPAGTMALSGNSSNVAVPMTSSWSTNPCRTLPIDHTNSCSQTRY